MQNAIFSIFAVGFIMASLILAGCDSKDRRVPAAGNLQPLPDQPPASEIEVLKDQFEPARRLKTLAGDFVSVESPGYACPTLTDLNGDGQLDLVVGQFDGGKMKVYFGLGSEVDPTEFGDADWIRSSGKPAEVPGIS